jgi:hypothetical protein
VVEFKSKHHTTDQIAALVRDALATAGLPHHAIFRAVHDAARNMIAGVRAADLNSVLCTAHQLQRTIVGAMAKAENLNDHLGRVKVRPRLTQPVAALMRSYGHLLILPMLVYVVCVQGFVRLVHKSNVACADLREHQQRLGLFQHKLIQSNATRWNSTHDMSERVVEQRAAIQAMYAKDDTLPPKQRLYDVDDRLKDDDFNVLIDVSATLRPFRKVSCFSTHTQTRIHTHTHTLCRCLWRCKRTE